MKKTISIILLLASCVAVYATQGALPGVFSVSATKKVQFSQGNLQFNVASGSHLCADGNTKAGTWRFASNQYDVIGSNNTLVSSTYNGWIDLFSWSTSGWKSSEVFGLAYEPYHATWVRSWYSPGKNESADLTGTYKFADWGVYNAISNGGNSPKQWRTLTMDEWLYIVNSRPNAASLWTYGNVNNINGLILLPDDWTTPSTISLILASTNESTNTLSLQQWSILEESGAVFLPAAGWRQVEYGGKLIVYWVGRRCCYYSSTHQNSESALFFDSGSAYTVKPTMCGAYKDYGMSVRLVQDAAPSYTVTFNPCGGSVSPTTKSVSAGGTYGTLPTPTRNGYTFDGWYTAASGGTKIESTTTVSITANQTLYAHWKANTYTVTFNANGGLIPTGGNMGTTPAGHTTTLSADRTQGTVIVTMGTSAFWGMTGDCPTREGYTFDGWWTDPTGGTQVYDATGACIKGTAYWDANSKWIGTSDLTVYAHWISTSVSATEGALPGTFSVSSTKKVYFSKGNLTYSSSGTHKCADGTTKSGTFSFENSQLSTGSKSSTNFNLFGWATSGWNNGATNYSPTSTAYAPQGYAKEFDLTGDHAYADWGVYNAISNGGNQPNLWRTLTQEEWSFLLYSRPNSASLRSVAKIGTYYGLILLPDNWIIPSGVSFVPNAPNYETNTYTTNQWKQLEASGAVFLSACGWRLENDIRTTYSSGGKGLRGCYHTSTYHSTVTSARRNYFLDFYSDKRGFGANVVHCGLSVRLVQDIEQTTYTITTSATNGTITGGGTYDYNSTVILSATPSDCYRFVRWSDGNTSNPRTVTVTGDATYTAIFEKVQYTITTAPDDATHGSTETVEKE